MLNLLYNERDVYIIIIYTECSNSYHNSSFIDDFIALEYLEPNFEQNQTNLLVMCCYLIF